MFGRGSSDFSVPRVKKDCFVFLAFSWMFSRCSVLLTGTTRLSAARVDLPTGVRRFPRSDPCVPRRRPRAMPFGSAFPAIFAGGTWPLRRAAQRRFVPDHLEVGTYILLCVNLANGGSTDAFQAWVGFAYQRFSEGAGAARAQAFSAGCSVLS